ncbi:DUF805 domain-containing protein [Phaeovibrio sulfidiphilus]|uniref:DUF805 domain-containing protein n=1 Tax=Phaeovibrio sulfidiphilus TaxID=1220600 RepID=A0A8J7CNU3_9PROT|nr:DUF805 domain-containing protein [Phaeovibrio sulfidiphilus]MBE1236302.1 DUF805 domain-containing protein [Phaeovibrio sulfidiphilus]
MRFTDAIHSCFIQYATFRGRAPRSEYWWFMALYVGLSSFVFHMFTMRSTAALALTLNRGASDPSVQAALAAVDWAPMGLIALVFFLPSLAVSVRRLHDVGKSGWNLLWSFVPVIGPILLFIWYCTRGTAGPNRWGAAPASDCACGTTH